MYVCVCVRWVCMYVWVQTAVLAFGGQQRDWVSPVALHLVPLRQGILWKLNVVFFS